MVKELNEDAVEERNPALGEAIGCSRSQAEEKKVFGSVDLGLLDDGVGAKPMAPGRKEEEIAKQGRWTV